MDDAAPNLDSLDAVAGDARILSKRVKDGVVTLVVDVTALDGARRAALESDLKTAAMAIAGVGDVRVAMTASQRARKLIAVASGKGGVGKSTLSANLAIALARAGRVVGLIDADVYGPSQTKLLGTDERPTANDKTLNPVAAHGIRFLSMGQLVSAGHALAWRGPMATGALAQLMEADWGDCDLLVVDLPPGTGDVQLSLVQKSRPDGAVVVSTPQAMSLIDATRAIDLFGKVSVPVLGLVENMAGYTCPHCGEQSDPFGCGGAEDAAAELGIPFLGRIPLDPAVREASDAGLPPAASDGAQSEAFARIAQKLLQALETAPA
ncbi:Mrp/NBP35 family ATP-binding protein [Sphingomonas sabuli]|uniref:Iron-sulfur cluster carrier protein n=1 Tax=Sphingomonas sabuli TaxID=2764186 RepID=A0A7G9L1H5_9SPHN|nr:Mrp/NBP35 family ATP-binding protein [Sphingomonas sabuli]QNM82474.1 Mrp/NBP35 family ATP-binding protein [Sphingomonas sabuli]